MAAVSGVVSCSQLLCFAQKRPTDGCGMDMMECCSVLQCVFNAVCCGVLQCVAVCCSVLQCVAVCCSVYLMQCVAVHFILDNILSTNEFVAVF